MIYWEKNKTEGMIEKKYFHNFSLDLLVPRIEKPDPLKLTAGEDYIYKHFCISNPYNGLVNLPDFTLRGFKI